MKFLDPFLLLSNPTLQVNNKMEVFQKKSPHMWGKLLGRRHYRHSKRTISTPVGYYFSRRM